MVSHQNHVVATIGRVARFPHPKEPVLPRTSHTAAGPLLLPVLFMDTRTPKLTLAPKGSILWYSTLLTQPPWPFRHVGSQASRPHSRWNTTIDKASPLGCYLEFQVDKSAIPNDSADSATLMTSERHCVHTRRTCTDTRTNQPRPNLDHGEQLQLRRRRRRRGKVLSAASMQSCWLR